MSNPYIGEIRMFGGNFAPAGWALCNGQLIAISQNVALFSLLGTFYGGNGVSTFALPNLQSRLPVHMGTGLGLSAYVIGEEIGTETVTLNTSQIPQHSHTVNASTATGSAAGPANAVPAKPVDPLISASLYVVPGTDPVTPTAMLSPISTAGGNQPHSNLMPFFCVSFIISLFGVFPSRN